MIQDHENAEAIAEALSSAKRYAQWQRAADSGAGRELDRAQAEVIVLAAEVERLRTGIELLESANRMLDPETPMEVVDAELQAVGIDPVEVGERGSMLAKMLLENRDLRTKLNSSRLSCDFHAKTRVALERKLEALRADAAAFASGDITHHALCDAIERSK